MVLKKMSAGMASLGFVLAAIDNSYVYVIPRITDGSWNILSPNEGPTLTLLVYQHLSNAASFGVGVVAVSTVGYIVGKQIELKDTYKPFIAVVSGSAVFGYLAQILLLALLTDISIAGGYLELDLTAALASVLVVPVQFGIAGFAGAAYAHITAASPGPTPSGSA